MRKWSLGMSRVRSTWRGNADGTDEGEYADGCDQALQEHSIYDCFASVSAASFSEGKSEVNIKHPNEMKENSKYEPLSNEDLVNCCWGIIQARLSIEDGKVMGTGGFCGTAWPISRTEKYLYFVTANHVANDGLFYPKEKPKETRVYICNRSGLSLRISPQYGMNHPSYDLAFIAVPVADLIKSGIETIPMFKFSKQKLPEGLLGMSTFNLGFPDRGQKGTYFKIDLDSDSASFDEGPYVQRGRIEDFRTVFLSAPDVKLFESPGLILDYCSEQGFSGGPLILEETDEVIGMMSTLIPNGDKPPERTIALPIWQIFDCLEK